MKRLFFLIIIVSFATYALSQTKVLTIGESTTTAAPGYRKKLVDLAKADNLSIDMIGPNTDGYQLLFDSDNAGFRGKTCSDLFKWVDSACVNYSPDIVVLWEGTNDCGWGYKFYIDNHPIIEELSLLVNEICIKFPNAFVFVATIPPMSNSAYAEYNTPAGKANANATAYNNAMPGMINLKIKEGKKVYFVDSRPFLNVSTDISSDGIHPNQYGYDKMGVLFYNSIRTFISTYKTENKNEVVVYPNPVKNSKLTIKSNNSVAGEISLNLYNIIGRPVYSADVKYSPSINITLPQYLKNGLYLLKINNGLNTVIKRIVIDK